VRLANAVTAPRPVVRQHGEHRCCWQINCTGSLRPGLPPSTQHPGPGKRDQVLRCSWMLAWPLRFSEVLVILVEPVLGCMGYRRVRRRSR
jgi:hypothetical protein